MRSFIHRFVAVAVLAPVIVVPLPLLGGCEDYATKNARLKVQIDEFVEDWIAQKERLSHEEWVEVGRRWVDDHNDAMATTMLYQCTRLDRTPRSLAEVFAPFAGSQDPGRWALCTDMARLFPTEEEPTPTEKQMFRDLASSRADSLHVPIAVDKLIAHQIVVSPSEFEAISSVMSRIEDTAEELEQLRSLVR